MSFFNAVSSAIGFFQTNQGEAEDASSVRVALSRNDETLVRQALAANVDNDLEVVRKAKTAGSYREPLSCLPAKKLFSMQHFALFRPIFHDFLELRLSLLQFQAQQRNIVREMGAIERLKKRRAVKLQQRLLTG